MHNRVCGEDTPCALHAAWERGQQAILEYLGGQTLDEFIEHNPLTQLPPHPNAPTRALPRRTPKMTLRKDRGRSYITE